ncbi:hypothetical protein Micbo1qcDRAFT_178097 [Microdochium bolleyi]|uniref:Uncharacterized protein n=1 Tax=Microdochium bolleyi TaxID=196109 RepID=A0A136IUG0_9PEZI|nr:hypothetical protein Micbo1qcDRAFT_178097 [Microdochium bolleyi]
MASLILTTAWRAMGRLPLVRRRIPTQPVFPLARLPAELIMVVMDQCESPADSICLGMALQNIYGGVGPGAGMFERLLRHISDTDHQRDLVALVGNLDRDHWRSFHCRRAQLASWWRPYSGTLLPLCTAEHHSCLQLDLNETVDSLILNQNHNSTFHFPGFEGDFRLPWCEARLIPRRAAFDLHDGRTARTTNLGATARVLEHGVRVREAWEGRVSPAAGHLVLCCTRTYTHDASHVSELYLQLLSRTGDVHVCAHNRGLRGHHALEVMQPGGTEGTAWRAQSHCFACDTDYEISKIRPVGGGGGDGWVLQVKTYHDVGPCRSPADHEWNAVQGRGPAGPTGPPGSVKVFWESGLEAEDGQGSWTEYWTGEV